MKTPDGLLVDLRRRVGNTWADTLTGRPTVQPAGEPGDPGDAGDAGRPVWPLTLPLGKPTKADLDTRWTDLRRLAIDWRTWADERGLPLKWETRMVRGTPQTLPTHLTIPDIDSAAALLGDGWPERLARARTRHAVLAEKFPHAAASATLRAVDRLTDIDFGLLCDAAAWFATYDATGYTPRQVPIEGLHGKWLNHNQALVTRLAGRDTLGLVGRPSRVHFTYLDPAHRAAGGRHHDSHTLGDTTTPAYPPRIAVITENKDSAVYFPEVPGGIAIEGNGDAAIRVLRIPWLAAVPAIVYWGDIDADGYEIVHALRDGGLPVTTILMDGAAYTGYERFGAWTDDKGAPIGCADRQDLHRLTDAEWAVYEQITDPSWSRVRRVEQERIPLDVAVQALVTSGSRLPGRVPVSGRPAVA